MNEYQILWNDVREQLKKQLATTAFEQTFKNVTEVVKEENGVIFVKVNTPYQRSHINSLYFQTISSILSTKTNKKLKFKFVTENEIKPKEEPKVLNNSAEPTQWNLNPNYSFESFVVGESNRQAYLAANKVAENPTSGMFNPLYIFGGVGLGKTHLMQAIGNYISDNNLNAKIVYVQASDFLTDYTRASRENNYKAFDEKYYNIDLLLIDDIQMLADKPGSQNQFFKLFNEMENKNKQIVITSDRPATKLNGFMDRLTSRFNKGLPVDINKPDFNQRVNILKKKALEKTEKAVPEQVLTYIAENFTDNVRELEGALNRVIQFSDWDNSEINFDDAKDALKIFVKEKKTEDSNYEKCLSVVAGIYGIDISEIIGVSRKAKITIARQMTMYILKNKYDFTYQKIGQILNGRDHTTIMSGCNKISDGLETNDEIKLAYENIMKKL